MPLNTQPVIAIGDAPEGAGGGNDHYQLNTSSDSGLTFTPFSKFEDVNGEIGWGADWSPDRQIIVIGTQRVGAGPAIYRSTDGGSTFAPATTQPAQAGLTIFAVRRLRSGAWMAGGDAGAVGPVLYRSTDDGDNWSRIAVADITGTSAASSQYGIYDILETQTDGQVVIGLGGRNVAGDNAQWRMSEDDGLTFPILPTLNDANGGGQLPKPWQLALADDGSVISNGDDSTNAAIESELWRGVPSAGAIVFSRVLTVGTNQGTFCGVVNLRNGTLLAFYESRNTWTSTDNGLNWTPATAIPTSRSSALGTTKIQCPEPGVALVGQFGNNLTGVPFVSRTDDSGATWTEVFPDPNPSGTNGRITNFLVFPPGITANLILGRETMFNASVTPADCVCLVIIVDAGDPVSIGNGNCSNCLPQAFQPNLFADSEHQSVSVPVYNNVVTTLVNNVPAPLLPVNDAGFLLAFITNDLVLSKSDTSLFGHYLGWHLEGSDPPFRFETVQMQFAPTRPWDTSP